MTPAELDARLVAVVDALAITVKSGVLSDALIERMMALAADMLTLREMSDVDMALMCCRHYQTWPDAAELRTALRCLDHCHRQLSAEEVAR